MGMDAKSGADALGTWSAIATAAGTIATGLIIFWQARLLRIQNQVSALLSLYSVWDSDRLLSARARWAANENDVESAEEILEFLEEFAGLGVRGVLKKRTNLGLDRRLACRTILFLQS
jgi:hypothetical protein